MGKRRRRRSLAAGAAAEEGVVTMIDRERSRIEPVAVMGVEVTPLASYEAAVERVAGQVEAGGPPSFWAAINPEKIQRAKREVKLRAVLSKVDVGICDGVGVSLAGKLLAGRWIPRCTGCDLFGALIAAAAERGWRVFLLGADPESNWRACENLRVGHPGLRIVGRQDGYFADADAVVERINESHADLLFVAMGSPAQEFWIAGHIDRLDVRMALGVGGSFDVASGKARRAPAWVRQAGLEFAYRALTTPGWSMRSRVRRTAVKFAFGGAVLAEWAKRRLGRRPSAEAAVRP